MIAMWDIIQFKFYHNFIADNRWLYIVRGLGVTLLVTALALCVGVALGVVVAVIRTAHDQQRTGLRGVGGFFLRVGNGLCRAYVTVLRGTPVMVQLLLMNFVVFVATNNKIFVAVVTFGLNSAAYVSEIVRGGLMSVDAGQMEAGRSLGLPYVQTMWKIIIPQAAKAILPALGNEFISLLKETSIVTVIGLGDLTKGAMIIQGRTYDALFPLVVVGLIYLALVMVISHLISRMERRLRQNDRR